MKKKSTTKSAFFSPRLVLALLLCEAACSIVAGTLPAFFRSEAPAKVSNRSLTFAERVAYQRGIEDVYWRHRIWPKERPDPKPSLDAVMSQAQLGNKVAGYLRDSQALEDYWQKPISAEQLQAEMERMARHTKQPEVLRELFEALGNDPAVIAECLARSVLTERLIADLSVQDQTRRFESPRTDGLRTMSVATTLGRVAYTLPKIANADDPPCTDDTWTATSTTNAPEGRYGHTAVWTGSEMIVWGGIGTSAFLNTGGRYNPATDSWAATSTTNAPQGRSYHTAVWTGNEMIVWGGSVGPNYFNTGGRYNPGTDTWVATSTTNAPDARDFHTAVWTGSEMIVWGGHNGGFPSVLNTGGRYNPISDSWVATSTTNAPAARELHTAVWTGSEMIVWGGDPIPSRLNTGGRYNPGTDSWTATSTTNAPAARDFHTAVWTGSEMIVWGGFDTGPTYFNTGGRYNPGTDTWVATGTTNAPSGRQSQTAVWTGSEMIVWGGEGSTSLLNTGGRYNPSTDSWTSTSTTNAPEARIVHTAVWTGSEMIVWGGTNDLINFNTGGRYCAQSGPPPTPTPTPTPVVTTNPATTVASFSATLNGSLNPRGSTTTVDFQYGLTTSYGFTTPVQTQTGNTVRPISANISGLMASHVYHFRIVAHNNGGTSFGSDRTFTTLTATGLPVVITSPATLIASFSATLNGSVDPHGLTTTVYFQYGTTTSYGLTTAPQSQAGSIYRNISANISGLLASTAYHFRIVATNSAGTIYGADRAFTTLGATGPPVVTTNPASYIASFTANLNGTVDPHGLTTTVHFQYGTTTSYGLTSMTQTQSGNTYRNVAAGISGLLASTTYHFRIVATNSAGTTYGADQVFTTLSATGPPVVTTRPATNVTSSSATLNGVVDPHGLTTSAYFQYGTTTSYGHNTPAQSKTGNTYQSVTANISGLSASTTYHFRIVATNSDGTRYGADMAFTTP
jgi:N-acetylneuraminic acid mutarotase